MNIATLLEAVTDAIADREILTFESEHRTYRQLEERANRLAHHLQSIGVGPGDHVSLHMRNRIEYVEALMACMKVRAVGINTNYRFTADELAHVYGDSQSAAVIVEAEYLDTALEAIRRCPAVGHVVVLDRSRHLPDPAAEGVRFVGYESALAAQSAQRDFGERSGDDRFIIYTGGTTGMPKGVVWRHEDFYYAALSGANLAGPPRTTTEQVVDAAVANDAAPPLVLIPPLMHGAATYSLLTAFLMGARRVIVRRFDPLEVIRIVEAERAVGVTVVGDGIARPLVEAMHAHPEIDVSSLQLIGSGGALFSSNVKDQLREHIPGLRIVDAFGASETGKDGMIEFASDGTKRIRNNPNMRLVDADMRPIPAGQEGFIARGGHVPLEYFRAPDKTAKTFPVVEGRRMAVLGDRGRMEGDGSIVLLGRGSTCINSGGEKIYPEEVEQALKTHPDVYDALVVGIDDERFGQKVAAVIALREDTPEPSTADLDAIAEHCRTHVAGYKIPRAVVAVPEIVRTPSGKADYPWATKTVLGAP